LASLARKSLQTVWETPQLQTRRQTEASKMQERSASSCCSSLERDPAAEPQAHRAVGVLRHPRDLHRAGRWGTSLQEAHTHLQQQLEDRQAPWQCENQCYFHGSKQIPTLLPSFDKTLSS